MVWTDDKITKLTELWDKGMTASDIGKIMGITRNMVMGKAHRLSLDRRVNPVETNEAKFERLIDLVADQDRNILEASREVGLAYIQAMKMWDGLVARVGWQAV
jgi:hypothetical protein